MGRARVLPIEMLDEVNRLIDRGFSPGQIKRDLGLPVSLRTVQRLQTERRRRTDDSGTGLHAIAAAIHDLADAIRQTAPFVSRRSA